MFQTRKIKRTNTYRTQKYRGGDDNYKEKSKPFGTIHHLQKVLKEGGIPAEYVDPSLLDPMYVNVTGDAFPKFDDSQKKLFQQMKILNYLAELEKVLEDNGDLTEFRKHAIEEYKEIMKVEFGPSLLTDSSIKKFNEDVTAKSKTFLEFIFAYENEAEKDDHATKQKKRVYQLFFPIKSVLDRYLAEIKKKTKLEMSKRREDTQR